MHMDWSKAKSILIVAFIVTNLFLAYVLFNAQNVDNSNLNYEFIDDVKSLLLEKDIKINSTIPTEIPSLPLLTIEYETYDPVELANTFFGEYTIEEIDGNKYYRKGNETLTIENCNELIYTSEDNVEKINSTEKEELIKLAEKFIKDKGFAVDDYKMSEFSENDGTYYIEFNKYIEGIFFEKSYMKFFIDEYGVKSFERYWVSSTELSSSNITLISAPRALLKLITIEDSYGKVITDITPCYYLDLQKHTSIGDPKKVKGGKATLAWRIKFDDGTKIFLEDN